MGALGTVLGLAASSAWAGSLQVGSGSIVGLGTAQLELGCADLQVSGTLDADASTVVQARHVSIDPGGILQGGSSSISLTGDWSNQGSFVAGTSSVAVVDGCGTASSTISGASTFHDFSVMSAQGKSLLLESGSTQTVTGSLTLAGAPGSLLPILGTSAGVAALLDLQGGAQQIVSVEVQDVHAIGDPLVADASSSLLGNTSGWTIFTPAVPALPWLAALLLAGALLLATRQVFERMRRPAEPTGR